MSIKWIKSDYPGVRYYEHEKRMHGLHKDRNFYIRYQVDGNREEERLGWASEGWSAKKAFVVLAKLKEGIIKGEGPRSLKEKRETERAKRKAEEQEKAKEERESITFSAFFKDTYFPHAKLDKREESYKREDSLFRHWIEPTIGKKNLKEISPIDIDRIKKKMKDEGNSPRSIQYALAVIRQVFNLAHRNGIYQGESPTKSVKQPKINNRRQRFLTVDQVNELLIALQAKSFLVYGMALISVHCGLRFGEIAALKWGDIDLKQKHIAVKNPKNGKSRVAFITNTVRDMLGSLEMGDPDELVFKDRNGERITKISRTFERTVEDLNFNKGITDPRDKVVFHTLRHTYASLLVLGGESLYTVKELLGQSTLSMTERYSHLGADTLQNAVKGLEAKLAG